MADTNSELMSLLKKIAIEQNYHNHDINIKPISTSGANYSSKLYLITITGDGKDDLRLFAKVAAIGENLREQSAMKPYDNERFVYNELVKVYRQLEEKNGISEGHKLALPKYYGADATKMQETLVLEDLACKGFVLHNRQEPVSWQFAAAAVTELAKFHALSMAYQHEDPSGFDKIVKTFQHGMFTDHEGNHVFYNTSVKSALGAVREENKEKLKAFLDGTSLAEFCSMYGPLQHPVLIHADFRASNMLYRPRDDGTVEVIVVDYQTVQAGCPVVDLLYFIFTATDGEFRAKHYQQLVDHYHSELSVALGRLGLDVEDKYSRADFELELKERLPYGLILAVIVLPSLMVAEDLAPAMDDDLTMASLAFVNTGAKYVGRINDAVDDYVAWGLLG